jgi:inorganic triphosphatase YgiF
VSADSVPADSPRNLPPPLEIELKLLAQTDQLDALKRCAVLARRTPQHAYLHNIYFDTADQALRQQRAALRLRKIGTGASASWLQTLKLAGDADTALSQRTEWEMPVTGQSLDFAALQTTGWPAIDPDGALFTQLTPIFTTDFARSTWLVRRKDGSKVEVALDTGAVHSEGKTLPICEVELELKAGPVQALFDVAAQLTGKASLLPFSQSKAERGYALHEGKADAPVHARNPPLTTDMAGLLAAQRVLSEMFDQFCGNLALLRTSDAPEVVHQARVGWRRLRSGLKLFAPLIDAPPDAPALSTVLSELRPLVATLGPLRDLDVAATDTLPQWAAAYRSDGDPARGIEWQTLAQGLDAARAAQRERAREALREPAVGAALLAVVAWLYALTARPPSTEPLPEWAAGRIKRLNKRLTKALEAARDPAGEHEARIIAKRLRYAVEATRDVLPEKKARQWRRHATGLQTSIGAARDLQQAITLATRFNAALRLIEFLRGVAAAVQSTKL